MNTLGTNTAYTQRSKLRRFIVALSIFSLACVSNSASAYTLLFGKWDDPTRGTGATVSWSFIADGAGVDTSNYHDGNLTGLSSIGTLRLSIDSTYGTGAFDAAVQRAFNTWASVANLHFNHVTDNGSPFAGTTAIDIRIGAYVFASGFAGGAGYGPPGNDLFFPDPLAGDLALSANNNFQIAPGAEGDLLPTPGGAYFNDIEGLILHELGHTLGLGHSTNPDSVMCGYVDSNFDGSACHYELINRQLDADDIAGMQFLYGPATPPYTVSGNVSGLATNKSVTLLNNGSDIKVVSSNGGFTFSNALASGSYTVTVAVQPAGQTCTISNGSGTISNIHITNVSVSCTNTYTVGGNISGLAASGLVLKLNSTNLIIANGANSFKFATALTTGTAYTVSVGIQPVGYLCTVSNGSGTISTINISNISINCARSYTVGGGITGLTKSGLILKLNGGANKIIPSGATAYTFATSLIAGTPYTVTLFAVPAGLNCIVANNPGVMGSANITNVNVSCTPQ